MEYTNASVVGMNKDCNGCGHKLYLVMNDQSTGEYCNHCKEWKSGKRKGKSD